MADEYTIYLQNESASTQRFWAFLERPQELASDPSVFANSSTMLAVAPNSPATNTFTIPLQYSVGAGASNNAVGLNTRITSNISQNAELDQKWLATYANVPPNMGPTLTQDGTGAGADRISIQSNPFDQVNNEANGWFSNMSFGIQTNQGYMGMTWSPTPHQTRTLTPTPKFYVAVGSFGENDLARWTDVSVAAAELTAPNSFLQRKATVTYTSTGEWKVTPGAPSSLRASIGDLARSHFLLSKVHSELVEKSIAE